jgi:hypothetical protein
VLNDLVGRRWIWLAQQQQILRSSQERDSRAVYAALAPHEPSSRPATLDRTNVGDRSGPPPDTVGSRARIVASFLPELGFTAAEHPSAKPASRAATGLVSVQRHDTHTAAA